MHLTAKASNTQTRQSGRAVDAELIDKSMALILEIGFSD